MPSIVYGNQKSTCPSATEPTGRSTQFQLTPLISSDSSYFPAYETNNTQVPTPEDTPEMRQAHHKFRDTKPHTKPHKGAT